MDKRSLLALLMLASLAGCASNTKVQNPVNYITFRDAPLVHDVEKGMTREQALRIGGTPSSTQKRAKGLGSCNNYVLNKEGQQQVYYVSFDNAGKVDGKGFLTCSELERRESN